jgi:undecaprenyl-diphosphatase
MDLFHAFILGLVEGVTEFLPVSSTGHMILAGKLLGLEQTEFLKTFEIAIQLGAILAVVVLYGRTLLRNREVIKRVLAAFVPTVIIGGIFYKLVKQVLLGSSAVVVWSLFLGGIFLIVFELLHREGPQAQEDLAKISYKNAVLIGVFQAVAMVPGVSRSAATIVGGLILGVRRKAIVEFSFLLAVPTMLAATVLDIVKSADTIALGGREAALLAVGFVTAFVVAIASIKFLLHFIQRNNFIPFGIYRVVAAGLFLLFS